MKPTKKPIIFLLGPTASGKTDWAINWCDQISVLEIISVDSVMVYKDCNIDPKITEDYIISFNHFLAFAVLTIFGLLAFSKDSKIKILTFYLLSISIILELLHLLIPVRTFQFSDLAGNILGVIIIIILYFLKNVFFQK